MAFLASTRPSTDNIATDQSTIFDSGRAQPAFPLPDIGVETRNAGRFSGELKSGSAHSSAIGDI